jgi:hypothetical protein
MKKSAGENAFDSSVSRVEEAIKENKKTRYSQILMTPFL